jgi:tetratricopeptide (TPR) repeat protein
MTKIFNITKDLISAAALCGVIASASFVFMTVDVAAQTKKEDRKYSNTKTKKVKPLPVKLSKDFGKIQEMMELEPKADIEGALNLLNKWKAKGDRVKPHARAKIYNFYGYIYATEERYPEAIEAYEWVLATPEIDEPSQNQAWFTLAQLYLQNGTYHKTVDYMKKWMARQEAPSVTSMLIIAKAYYSIGSDSKDGTVRIKNYRLALPHIVNAIETDKAKGKPPVENTYNLLRVMYYELKNIHKMKETLEFMVKTWPKKIYYMGLANANYMMTDVKGITQKEADEYGVNQMLFYEMAYIQGMLKSSSELTNMAQLYHLHEAPYRSSKVLNSGLKSKKIDPVRKNYEALASAYLASGEYKKALSPLLKAVNIEKSSKLYTKYGYTCWQLYDYECAAKYMKLAIDKPDVKNPGSLYMTKGMAEVNLRRYKSARVSFKQAMKNKKLRKGARGWLKNVDYEEKRWAAVKEYLHKK